MTPAQQAVRTAAFDELTKRHVREREELAAQFDAAFGEPAKPDGRRKENRKPRIKTKAAPTEAATRPETEAA